MTALKMSKITKVYLLMNSVFLELVSSLNPKNSVTLKMRREKLNYIILKKKI